MNGISNQKNAAFGLNTRQFKSFLNSPEAKELGVSLKREIGTVQLVDKEEPVKAMVLSLTQKGDVLNINNGNGISQPLQAIGKNALTKLMGKLQNIKGAIIPDKEDFATRVCFRPLKDTVKAGSEKLKAAITRAAKE